MIGIITDTHENVPAIEAAVSVLKQRNPKLVIHCGDIISPPVLEHFKDLPMIFVFGNNDGEKDGLKNRAEILGFKIDIDQEIKLEGKKIFVCHGHRKGILRNAINSEDYDYVISGHTHVLKNEKIGKTRVINVGCMFKPLGGQDFYSIGFLENDNLELVKFDMQTLEVVK